MSELSSSNIQTWAISKLTSHKIPPSLPQVTQKFLLLEGGWGIFPSNNILPKNVWICINLMIFPPQTFLILTKCVVFVTKAAFFFVNDNLTIPLGHTRFCFFCYMTKLDFGPFFFATTKVHQKSLSQTVSQFWGVV